jgi:hypothetical protein
MRRSGPAILSLILLLALSPLSALAGPPVASIKGPKTAAAGDLVILDASGSDATTFTWVLANSDKTFLPVDGGKRCVFSSGTGGRFVFVLVVGKVEGGQSLAAETQWSVVIGGDVPVPPNPLPPIPPAPIPPDPTPPNPLPIPIPPSPTPTGIEGVGTVYGKSLDVSLAMAWESAADVLEKGGTMADAMKAYQDNWKANREKLWTTFGAVEFAKVVPDASDVSDPAKRASIVKLWRGFANGLRAGAK